MVLTHWSEHLPSLTGENMSPKLLFLVSSKLEKSWLFPPSVSLDKISVFMLREDKPWENWIQKSVLWYTSKQLLPPELDRKNEHHPYYGSFITEHQEKQQNMSVKDFSKQTAHLFTGITTADSFYNLMIVYAFAALLKYMKYNIWLLCLWLYINE